MAKILVCDDEAGLREMLGVLLRRAGHELMLADGTRQALETIENEPPFDAVITDLLMPDGSGMTVLEAAHHKDERTQILMITAYATTEQAVEAMRLGAYDYVQKPFKNHELLATLEKALEKRTIVDENRALRAQVRDIFRTGDLVAKSPAMRRVTDLIARVARTRVSVLITGESGTGKEMVARAIHEQSDRPEGPFVVVNCGALPEALMESELFGHEKGAFTGAVSRKDGLFRAAHGGTLFLDEIGELPLSLQVKLLRVLQEKKVRPVGSESEIEVDVRVLAATNRNIETEVAEERFRQDLFYRLNVIRIHLPPLRERPEDVALLIEHFLQKHCALQSRHLALSQEALRWLTSQRYPGNVRELENVMERAVTLAMGPRIGRTDLPEGGDNAPPLPAFVFPQEGFRLEAYLEDLEKKFLMQALEQASGIRTSAAKLVGMSFRSFRYRLAKYGIGDADSGEDDGSDSAAS